MVPPGKGETAVLAGFGMIRFRPFLAVTERFKLDRKRRDRHGTHIFATSVESERCMASQNSRFVCHSTKARGEKHEGSRERQQEGQSKRQRCPIRGYRLGGLVCTMYLRIRNL